MLESAKVMRYFDRASVMFDSLYSETRMSSFSRFVNRLFRRDIYERFLQTIEHVRQSKARSVLDVGCGSGRYARAYAEIGVGRVVGVDLSANMIDLARQHTREVANSKTKYDFVQTDFMGFMTSETFDVVVAMGFFDYIGEPITILKKMKLLSEHSVIASFPSISWYRTPIRKFRYFYKKCPVYFYKQATVEDFAVKAGFSGCTVAKIKGAGMDYIAIFRV